jgi:hypothetical protein
VGGGLETGVFGIALQENSAEYSRRGRGSKQLFHRRTRRPPGERICLLHQPNSVCQLLNRYPHHIDCVQLLNVVVPISLGNSEACEGHTMSQHQYVLKNYSCIQPKWSM